MMGASLGFNGIELVDPKVAELASESQIYVVRLPDMIVANFALVRSFDRSWYFPGGGGCAYPSKSGSSMGAPCGCASGWSCGTAE